jgi:hypothetical protein
MLALASRSTAWSQEPKTAQPEEKTSGPVMNKVYDYLKMAKCALSGFLDQIYQRGPERSCQTPGRVSRCQGTFKRIALAKDRVGFRKPRISVTIVGF